MGNRVLKKDYEKGLVILHNQTYEVNTLPDKIRQMAGIYGIGIVLQREGAGKNVSPAEHTAKADKRWQNLLQGEWKIPSEKGEVIRLKKDDIEKAKTTLAESKGLTAKEKKAVADFLLTLGVKV